MMGDEPAAKEDFADGYHGNGGSQTLFQMCDVSNLLLPAEGDPRRKRYDPQDTCIKWSRPMTLDMLAKSKVGRAAGFKGQSARTNVNRCKRRPGETHKDHGFRHVKNNQGQIMWVPTEPVQRRAKRDGSRWKECGRSQMEAAAMDDVAPRGAKKVPLGKGGRGKWEYRILKWRVPAVADSYWRREKVRSGVRLGVAVFGLV
jgi:hypothetical protein